MRRLSVFLAAFLLTWPCGGETLLLSADLPSGAKLHLQVRSGDVRIVGADENRISVEASGKNAHRAQEIRVTLEKTGDVTKVRIRGGPKNDLTLTIRVPHETDLYARIPFGEVHVGNVAGNKDIELHAGDLTVAVGDAAEYRRVDASVSTGELDGSPWGEHHGGLFRSFHKEGSGRYRLHAHVGAGDLTLE